MPGEASQHRFAVLHHTGVSCPHYDLLIETASDAALLTFRCESWPLRDGDVVTRQPDHRRIYLDYEGPISGDRGDVRRVASGTCRVLDQSNDAIRVVITSASQTQTIALATKDGTNWRVQL